MRDLTGIRDGSNFNRDISVFHKYVMLHRSRIDEYIGTLEIRWQVMFFLGLRLFRFRLFGLKGVGRLVHLHRSSRLWYLRRSNGEYRGLNRDGLWHFFFVVHRHFFTHASFSFVSFSVPEKTRCKSK